jgi:Family of unknown function (DUF6527)
MSYFIKTYHGVRDWLQGWLTPTYRTVVVEEYLPKKIQPRVLYIVEEDGSEEQAAMVCPCGCRKTLHMNLLPDDRPCWKVTKHANGTATLHPSVWRKVECRSHFWFRRGKVNWCRGTE